MSNIARSQPVRIQKVETTRDFRVFLEFPWTLYKGDPNWVPPLLSMRRHLLDKKKNPAWEYMSGDYFLAWRGDRPVGTIAAFVNHHHNEVHQEEQIGWFGAFECFDDREAANALLGAAADYIRGLGGYTAVRGPATFTLNDECGLLIENFEPPMVLMPYNPAYYQRLIEESGLQYEKVMDVVSVWTDPSRYLNESGQLNPKLERVVSKVAGRKGVTTRRAEVSRLTDELKLLRDVYEKAWQRNWGFVPATERELDDLFATLKQYFHPGLGVFGLVDGEVAGFMLGMPDMNQVLHRAYARPGEPELWTMLKALWHWKIRPKITRQRVVLFGVKPEFQQMGVDAAIFLEYIKSAMITIPNIDAGWILETNQPVLINTRMFNAHEYKRYRFYQKSLD